MSFVIFDVETTGLRPRFDQILQFAAVKTDANLQVIDRIDTRIRLMPHILPSPTALHVNGAGIGEILSGDLATHYQAVGDIAAKLRSWSPAVFLGYNSIRFDEEFLRQALYLCLHPPFLTNTNGNTRADVLNLARAVAALEPGALQIPVEEGRPCFRLEAIARANGFVGGAAHDAAHDVDATLHICRLIADRAPEIWSRFLRFAQRRVVSEFVAEEEAFVYFDQVGASHSTHIVTSLGASPTRPTLHFCLDLKADLGALASSDAEALAEAINDPSRPIRRLRLNTAPLLIPLYEAASEIMDGRSEEDYLRRARKIRENGELVTRLKGAAMSAERVYPDSCHVEEQIYSGEFPSDEQADLMLEFHAVDWSQRREVAAQFEDPRHRTLAKRLLFLERPDLLSADHKERILAEVARRRRGEADPQPACLTLPEAEAEIALLLSSDIDNQARARLNDLADYFASLRS